MKGPGLQEWRAALDAMRTAHRLEPGNPALAEDMGRLYDWGSANKAPDNPATVAFREQALVDFRLAARQRITSPYAWSNLASMKLKLRQIDAELLHAMGYPPCWAPGKPRFKSRWRMPDSRHGPNCRMICATWCGRTSSAECNGRPRKCCDLRRATSRWA